MVMAKNLVRLNTEEINIDYDKNDFTAVQNHHGFTHTSTPLAAKALVKQVLQDHIARIDTDTCEPGEEDAFYVADLGEVYRQHMRWKTNLPQVKPFYAVKCNPDEQVIRLLARLGSGFDCASKAEIDLVLGLGVDPTSIIYAQPCKTKSYLRHARQVGVSKMTFDNADELYKIKNCFPDAEIVLRILTDDSTSMCRLSTKFGADLSTASDLLALAKDLNLNVIGVSFHVGSGASDPSSFAKAVTDAKWVFEQASFLGYNLQLLDVGGGFTDETFEIFAARLNESLAEHFPPHIRVIAEPGRYYTANAFTLAANIIARRTVMNAPASASASASPSPPLTPTTDDSSSSTTNEQADSTSPSYMLYLNDGVYGNFSNIIFDHQHPTPQILHTSTVISTNKHNNLTEYSIWGPTCDGIDMISTGVYLPGVLDVGDWLFFEGMGAYTRCSATRFNGFADNHEVVYVCSEAKGRAVLGW